MLEIIANCLGIREEMLYFRHSLGTFEMSKKKYINGETNHSSKVGSVQSSLWINQITANSDIKLQTNFSKVSSECLFENFWLSISIQSNFNDKWILGTRQRELKQQFCLIHSIYLA